jgi:putative flippase GtrA
VLRFLVAGVINTFTYLLVLTTLCRIFDVYKDKEILPFTVIAFAIAVTQSYFINQKWTFKENSKKKTKKEFIIFIIITAIGQSINTFIIYLLTSYFKPSFINEKPWVTVSGMLATGVSMCFNFISYKIFVFKDKKNQKYVSES